MRYQHAVWEQHAIQVIVLVLEDPSSPALQAQLHPLSVYVLGLDLDAIGPLNGRELVSKSQHAESHHCLQHEEKEQFPLREVLCVSTLSFTTQPAY